jgi:hypothetical protein
MSRESRRSSPLDLGGIDLNIPPPSPKKWNKEYDDYLFGAVAMKEYIERMNVLVLEEIGKGHIKYKINEDRVPRIFIKDKEVFKADYGYNESSGFVYIGIATPSVYYDEIELRWWMNEREYSRSFYVYKSNPYMNETSLARFLLMMCVFRSFDSIVDLTFGNRIDIPDDIIRFEYLTRNKTKVNEKTMSELKPLITKFKESIHNELPPPDHEEQYTDYKNTIGKQLVSFITDAYGIQSAGKRTRKIDKKRKIYGKNKE